MNPYPKKLDINWCSEAELLALGGVGPELAAAIMLRRPYGSVLGLRSVPGVSAKLYEELRVSLHVEHGPPASKLELNAVSLRELLLVPAMNADVAERILLLRPFASVADLKWLPEVSSEQFTIFCDWFVVTLNAAGDAGLDAGGAAHAGNIAVRAGTVEAAGADATQADTELATGTADDSDDEPGLVDEAGGEPDAAADDDANDVDDDDADDEADDDSDDDGTGSADADDEPESVSRSGTGLVVLPAGLVPLPLNDWAGESEAEWEPAVPELEATGVRSAAPSADRLPDEMATFDRPDDTTPYYNQRSGSASAARRALQWLGSPQVRGLVVSALAISAFAGGLYYVVSRPEPVPVVAAVPTATALPPTATTVPTQVPTPTAEPSAVPTPIGRTYRLRLSHYWPALGGTNCHATEWVDGKCNTQLAGKPWLEWAGIGAACPKEIPAGTEISIAALGRSVICVDQGGAIEVVADGSFFIDLIQREGFFLPGVEVIKDLYCPQTCFVVDGLVIPKANTGIPGSTAAVNKADWFTVRLGHWWEDEWGAGCELGKPLLGCNYKINGQPVQSWIGVGAKCPSDFELGSMVYVAVLEAQVTCLVVGEKRALDGSGFMIMLQPYPLFLPAAQIVRDGDCPSSCFVSQAKKLVPNP